MASSARIDELLKKFDENPRRYFAPLANEYRKAGDLERAIVICQEYLPQQPGHMSGHIVYGQALFELARLEEARQVFETALSLDPENLIALRHLGDIARQVGDSRAARSWYQRVLEADPRNEEIAQLMLTLLSTPALPVEAVAAEPVVAPLGTPAVPSTAVIDEVAASGADSSIFEVEKSTDQSGLAVGPELSALPERQAPPPTPAWTPTAQIPEDELLDLEDFSVGGISLSEISEAPPTETPNAELVAEESATESFEAFVTDETPSFVADNTIVFERASDTGVSATVSVEPVEEAPDASSDTDELSFEADPFAIASAPTEAEPEAAFEEAAFDLGIVANAEPEATPDTSANNVVLGLETFEAGSFVGAPAESEPAVSGLRTETPSSGAGAIEFDALFDESTELNLSNPFSVPESDAVASSNGDAPVPLPEEPFVEETIVSSFDSFAHDAPVVEPEPELERVATPALGVETQPSEFTLPIAGFEAEPSEFTLPIAGVEAQHEKFATPIAGVEAQGEEFATPFEGVEAQRAEFATPIMGGEAQPEAASEVLEAIPALPEPSFGDPVEVEDAGLAPAAFVTETMADLYLQQGHVESALDIYRQLVAQKPHDSQLRDRMRVLEDRVLGREAESSSESVAVTPAGPTIRDFLLGLVAGPSVVTEVPAPVWSYDAEVEQQTYADVAADAAVEEAIAYDAESTVSSIDADFGILEGPASIEEEFGEPLASVEESYEAPVPPVVSRATPAPAAETVRGSIDALFSGAGASSTPDSSAAATLAQAFPPEGPETDPLEGMPAHTASNELSLDHVFKTGQTPRPSDEGDGFSFDQFFADDMIEGGGTKANETPDAAPETGDDIAQFNSWLNGLKKT